jgi:hypothetical protein
MFPVVLGSFWQDNVSGTCLWTHLVPEELGDYFEYWEGGMSASSPAPVAPDRSG